MVSITRKLSSKADFKIIQRYLIFYIKIIKKCMPKPGKIQIEKFMPFLNENSFHSIIKLRL